MASEEEFQREMAAMINEIALESERRFRLQCEGFQAELTAIFSKLFRELADETGLPAEEAAAHFFALLDQQGRAERWGPMPEEYDPKSDPDHPSNGYGGVD